MINSSNESLESLRQDGYEIVDFRNENNSNPIYPVIAINHNDIIGRGSYGNVYKGYPVDALSGQLIKNKVLAIKIYKGSHDLNPQEARFFGSYYGGCDLMKDGEDMYMVMTYLPGENIMDEINNKKSWLNVEISKLQFNLRIDVICNIMMAINIIHHRTPNTGEALVHGDINGSNIKVHIDPDTNKVDVYIVDFGLAQVIEDDPKKMQATDMTGTPLFMPNEVVEHEVRGIKSDIYALTPIFASILGAENPFSMRRQLRYFDREYYKTPYDFTGIFSKLDVPEYPFDIKTLIVTFLTFMQEVNPNNRPDSDDALKFFVTLNKMCKLFAYDKNDPEVQSCFDLMMEITRNLSVIKVKNSTQFINNQYTFFSSDAPDTGTVTAAVNNQLSSPAGTT
jgi:serine/threonine protein kinase